MVMWNVESRSGSKANPPRCGVSPSCSPQGRRRRHDDSTGNDGPRRRLHHKPERARTGVNPSDRLGTRHPERPGIRSAGRLSRGLRPVGTVASSGTRRSRRRDGSTQPARGGPVRPYHRRRPDRCLHQPRHAASDPPAVPGHRDRDQLACQAATHLAGAGPIHRRVPPGRLGTKRPGPPARTPGQTALPRRQPANPTLSQNTLPRTSGSGDQR